MTSPSTHSSSHDPVATGPELDLQGLRCPLPVLRTRKHLAGMQPGTAVRLLCTDPLAVVDIPHLLRETGDVLVGHATVGEVHVFEIRKR